MIRSFFRLNREAKGYVCRPVENFQDVIAKSTTELARSPLLRKQLNAAIASVTFGTSGVGFLHFSFRFSRSFPAANHQTETAPARDFGRSSFVIPLKSSLRSSSNRRTKTTLTRCCVALLGGRGPRSVYRVTKVALISPLCLETFRNRLPIARRSQTVIQRLDESVACAPHCGPRIPRPLLHLHHPHGPLPTILVRKWFW